MCGRRRNDSRQNPQMPNSQRHECASCQRDGHVSPSFLSGYGRDIYEETPLVPHCLILGMGPGNPRISRHPQDTTRPVLCSTKLIG